MEDLIVKEAVELLLNASPAVALALPGGWYEHPAPPEAVGVLATYFTVSDVNVPPVGGRGPGIMQNVLAQLVVYVPGNDSTAAGPALQAIREALADTTPRLLENGWWYGAVRLRGITPPEPNEEGGRTWSAYGDEWRCFVQALA